MTTTHVPKVANDMRSLNVRTESGVQLFGFDAELYLKRKAQEDPERSKKILEWVETVSGMEFYDKSNLFACLKSGIHLCMVIQKTFPELIKKVNKSSNARVLRKRESTVHLELDNLKMFSNACETLGLPVFDPHEFHEGGISDPVMNSIEHFAKLANQTHPTTVPTLNLQGKPNSVTSPRRVSLVWPPPRPTSSEGDVEQSNEGEKSENSENIQTKAPRRLSDPPSKNWVPRRRSNTVDEKSSPNTHRRNKSEQMNREPSPPPKKTVKVVKIVTKKKVDSSKSKSEGDVKKKVEKIEQNAKEEIKPTVSVTAASKEKEVVNNTTTNKNNNGGGFSKSLYFGLGVIFGVGLSFAFNILSKKSNK